MCTWDMGCVDSLQWKWLPEGGFSLTCLEGRKDAPICPLTPLIFPFHIPCELPLSRVTFPSPLKGAPAQNDQSLAPSMVPKLLFSPFLLEAMS